MHRVIINLTNFESIEILKNRGKKMRNLILLIALPVMFMSSSVFAKIITAKGVTLSYIAHRSKTSFGFTKNSGLKNCQRDLKIPSNFS